MWGMRRIGIVVLMSLSLCINVHMVCKIARLQDKLQETQNAFVDNQCELKQRQTAMVIDSLLLQANLYKALKGEVPPSMDFFEAPFDGDGPNWPLDCFGNRLSYMAGPGGTIIISGGKDGAVGTEDDIVGRLAPDGLSREIKSPVGNWFSGSSGCGH